MKSSPRTHVIELSILPVWYRNPDYFRVWAACFTNSTICSQIKGLSSEEFAARNDLVHALPDRIQDIPDGTPAAPKQTGGGWTGSASRTEIKFDSSGNFFLAFLRLFGASSMITIYVRLYFI